MQGFRCKKIGTNLSTKPKYGVVIAAWRILVMIAKNLIIHQERLGKGYCRDLKRKLGECRLSQATPCDRYSLTLSVL